MTNKELESYIEEVSQKGSVLGLALERELLSYMGNPEKKLKFIHIAGSNGKGSILAYISTILKEAGYKVGRYISPVITDYREKIQINGRMISKKSLLEGMEYIKSITDSMDVKPTIFEVETALSFWYFEKMHCDIVVLETGLGGRDDASNVIEDTLCSVFASISMDHMAILGNTLEEIARVKSGIIKSDSIVVTGRQNSSVLEILKEVASANNSSFIQAELPYKISYKLLASRFSLGEFKNLTISLAGVWQPENAAVAIAAVKAIRDKGYQITDKAIIDGLKKTDWFGRFSVISKKPLLICDGAHNEDASKRLAETIDQLLDGKKLIFIMGVLKDKEYEKVIANTVQRASQIITLTPAVANRALPAMELAKAVAKVNPNVTVTGSVEEAVETAYELVSYISEKADASDCAIIAFGSLSYLGHLKEVVEKKTYCNHI